MVVATINGKKQYLDGNLKKNLDYLIPRVKNKNNMHLCIVDGRPGTGKSTFVGGLAHYCSDGDMALDDECFTFEQFENSLKNARPGQNIILDEAFELLNRRKSASDVNFRLLSIIQKMRAKRVFIWIVLPYVYGCDYHYSSSCACPYTDVWSAFNGIK